MKNKKAFIPHLWAVLGFLVITLAYCFPVLEGKAPKQEDMEQVTGMRKELDDYKAKTGKYPLWVNNLFGGMPAYQIYSEKSDYTARISTEIFLNSLPQPVGLFLLYFICFYVLLIVIGASPLLAFAGAVSFGLGSYNLIIIDVGHITKAMAIAYMALVLAGMWLLFTKNTKSSLWYGFALFTLGMGFEVYSNHFQVTYYLGLMAGLFILFHLVTSIRKKELPRFFQATSLAIVGVIIAVGANFTTLATTWEYSKETMRGNSELKALENQGNSGSGLDKEYALNWSYGIGETGTFLIPNFYGGASVSELSKKSEAYQLLSTGGVPKAQADAFIKQVPTYFGTQPFTAGPTYFGAIVIFLFVLGLILVKGPEKWWLLSVTVIAVMLSWGKNLEWFTDIFFNNVPLYNKFRAVAMIQVLASVTMPLLGFMAISRYLKGAYPKAEFKKALTISTAVVGGFCLIFALMPGMFLDFNSAVDENFKSFAGLVDAIQEDRASLVSGDAFRSLVFVLLIATALWFYNEGKLKQPYLLYAIIGLSIIDLWGVGKRYLNDSDFVAKRTLKNPYQMTNADQQILQDTDPYFRVLNLTVNTFNENSTSFFHKSLGGYHAAKLGRYEDIKTRYLATQNPDLGVVSMFNTKYIIVQDKERGASAQRNMGAVGNSWFVQNYAFVKDAKEEIDTLAGQDPAITAFIDQRYKPYFGNKKITFDPTAKIDLSYYSPDTLKYKSNTSSEQLALFSEIYYDKGWEAFIDGNPAEYIRANYALRAMVIPAGTHEIEFRFVPKSFYQGEKVTLAFSAIFALALVGGFFMGYKTSSKD